VTTTTQTNVTSEAQFFKANDKVGPFRLKRLALAIVFIALALSPARLGELTRSLIVDAYTQVSVFVAVTLLLFYGAERLFKFDIGESLKHAKRWQVPIATLLGATPGCGGAVVVIAAYSSGNVTFGAVVATLTATMGDAAFLLIAKRPDAAMVILPLALFVGVISGWFVNRFNRVDLTVQQGKTCQLAPRIGKTRLIDFSYLLFVIPGLYVGAAQLAQVTVTSIFGISTLWFALSGALCGLLIWSSSPLQAMTNSKDGPITRMAEETSFISIWVLGAYLGYDYAAEFAGLDITSLFSSFSFLLPLMGVLVGFIPGCGPQVLVSTLYINGVVPFSALLGNAISNDGDALFPAIALNPKAAFLATAYSAIPAVILAYAFYLFAPNFMK